jgi:molecular chaperone GrpE
MTGKSAKKDDAVKEATALLEEVIAEMESSRKETLDMIDLTKRIQADFDNYRKRNIRENEEFRKYANESLISDMLGIVDDLERALAHADPGNELAIGVNAIRQNLMKLLSSKGLTEIPADGKFDPNLHEALCTVDGEEDGNIAEVFLKGYRIGDRIIRYTKVKVTKKQREAEEGEQKCQGS